MSYNFKKGKIMRYKIKYKIEMTIDDDTYTNPTSSNGKKWAIISDPNLISGSLDKIMTEINVEISKIANQLEVWFIGEEKNNEKEKSNGNNIIG